MCIRDRVYTDIFRGLPEVVIILLIGLGVGPLVSGLTHNNPYPLGIAALGLTAAAYIGEILRSGIQSVDPGQLEAARALGFSYSTALRLFVVPQGIRRVLPALVNQLIALLKASALVYFLGLIAQPVSYTHLDVYKRQPQSNRAPSRWFRANGSFPVFRPCWT